MHRKDLKHYEQQCQYRTEKEGNLVGFKAAPGTDCGRLFAHARENGNGLDMAQAIRYVTNQYKRG